jgi:hypothetical protein
MVPLTCTALGTKRLAREVESFWSTHSCTSFYYIDEAIAFCDHLKKRIGSTLRSAYLEEVVDYERAGLQLQRPRTDGAVEAVAVRFNHDPETLLTQLSFGRRPRAIPVRRCTLTGNIGAGGDTEWIIAISELPASRQGP